MPYIVIPILIFFGVVTAAAVTHVIVRRIRMVRQHARLMADNPALTHTQMQALERHFDYYKGLDEASRRRFAHRVAEVMAEKYVQLQGINDPHELAELVIVASLVQLTFGLPAYRLPHFTRITLVPGPFRAGLEGRAHQGLVTAKGEITLSWEDLLTGLQDPTDAYALGLHEMAHALFIENKVPNEEFGFLTHAQLDRWLQAADPVLEQIRTGTQSLFRDYAGTNEDELFAVGVEYFFEQPAPFQHHFPELYDCYCSLLNQDPRNRQHPVLSLKEAMDW